VYLPSRRSGLQSSPGILEGDAVALDIPAILFFVPRIKPLAYLHNVNALCKQNGLMTKLLYYVILSESTVEWTVIGWAVQAVDVGSGGLP
jgi:hypothetical protein